MKQGVYFGNQAHAPANSRLSLISAYTGGADVLHLAVRLTKDNHLVLCRDEDVTAATGTAGLVSQMTWAELRELDFSERFIPRKSLNGEFHYFDPLVKGRRFNLDNLTELVRELPRDVDWIIEVRPEHAADMVAQLLHDHGALARSVLALETMDAVPSWRTRFPKLRTALILQDIQSLDSIPSGGADILMLQAERVWRDGTWTQEAERFAESQLNGSFPLGAYLIVGQDVELNRLLAAAHAAPWVWAVSGQSTFDVAAQRPSYVHVEEAFAGDQVDRAYFALGYAKANPYATVTWNDGIHIAIAPYTGPLPVYEGNATERRLGRLEWDLIGIAKDWPFYSGGGLGLTVGITDDFAAEVSYTVEVAAQATTLEMAALNVDPGAHRSSPPASFRDKDSFYDPHGAPPYVGVEHDEDDGFRINWNLGVEYDNNQYGKPVGDGRSAHGARLRLERRGAYFSAYYRDPIGSDGTSLAPRDWVCVGAVRNDSLNRTVYLRCVGKRWRQEKADDPARFEPIIPNRFVFKHLRIDCFPSTERE